MRILKVAIVGLVTAVAMFFSLMVALGVAVVGLAVFFYLRLRGRRAPTPFRRSAAEQPSPSGAEVIDVTATEVRSTRPEQ